MIFIVLSRQEAFIEEYFNNCALENGNSINESNSLVKSKIVYVLLVVSNLVFSQQKITGKIYGEKAVAKHVRITNITQDTSTYSDEKGDFSINASENDTISFESSFYIAQKIRVKALHFTEILVIQLKNQVNELEEVALKNKTKEKEFSAEKQNLNLNNKIRKDKKNNLHRYQPTNYNFDFVAVFGLIYNLLKSKKKRKPTETYISYKDLDELFKKSHFFNDALLKNTLKITSEYKYLFFDYCEGQNIKSDYLKKENEFLLLDSLVELSSEFLSYLN